MDDITIGLISDTHGLLRPQIMDLFDGCDLIINAGDAGSQDVLSALEGIAPVHTVRGNTDRDSWAWELPETEMIEAGGKSLYVIHDISLLDIDPGAAGVSAVIYGHSHMPSVARQDGVLYVNPGSAGPRRFGRPVSAGIVHIQNGRITARTIKLKD